MDEEKKKPEPRNSVSAQLARLALQEYRIGVTEAGDPFGVHHDHPHIARMLRGGKTGMRQDLSRRYFDEHKVVPSQQALADACTYLEGYAQQQAPEAVHLRVAERDGVVYIDMGDADAHVIEIHDSAWDIGVRAAALFRRTKLTGSMPKPFADGELSRLWEFVPINEDDRPLLLAWLVQALIRPNTAHPVLVLIAEQGSAKSTITRCLVDLVDPSPVPLRKPPRDADSWVTAANASWVVAIDNLSGPVPQWLSDCLCRAVTGDGDVRRQLYSDSDVSVVAFRRCLIINGVDIQVTQGDLAERQLAVNLGRVAKRRDDTELTRHWADARPDILGGLLTLAAQVQTRLTKVKVDELPRMADFALVLAAVDQALATDGLARYRERSKWGVADTLDTPFIAKLVDLNYSCRNQTSAEILAALRPADRDWKPPKDWPGNAKAVTGQLTRHAPALRAQGWSVEDDGGRNHRNRAQWTITPPEKVCKPDSQHSPDSSSQVSAQNGREKCASYTAPASQDASYKRAASQDDSSDSRTNAPSLASIFRGDWCGLGLMSNYPLGSGFRVVSWLGCPVLPGGAGFPGAGGVFRGRRVG